MFAADTLTGALARHRLEPGDVVAAIGDNSTAIWPLLEAASSLGLVLAIFNDVWSPAYVGRLFGKLGPQLVVGYGRHTSHPSADLVDCWVTDDHSLAPAVGERSKRNRVDHDLQGSMDGAVVFCTSGSTGDPKCVVSTPRNRAFSTRTIGTYLGLQEGQCIINALSPSFDYGLYQGLLAGMFGLTMDLVSSPQMTGELLARIRKLRRVVLPLTPALAARLCRAMKPDEVFPDVEIVSLTGGGTSLGLRRQLAAAFPNARIFAMYGLTECKRVAYLDPAEFLNRPYSCGRPMAGVTATIRDAMGRAVEPGTIGELTIEGENVCPGYWGDPAATRRRFRATDDGRIVLFTGDRFRTDKDGYLEFISRNDEQVKIRDERVNLGTIERELRSSKLVLDLALRIELDDLGIPLLTASIVPESPTVGESDLLRSFRQCVSTPGHLPHRVVIVSEIPISEHGKHMADAGAAPASPQP
jgi:acyl-coenzyme A synthetase/AMP-(fatty) acid ligase